MNECQHEVMVYESGDGYIVTICKKCGKILDKKKIGNAKNEGQWMEGLLKDNGGQILHD